MSKVSPELQNYVFSTIDNWRLECSYIRLSSGQAANRGPRPCEHEIRRRRVVGTAREQVSGPGCGKRRSASSAWCPGPYKTCLDSVRGPVVAGNRYTVNPVLLPNNGSF